MEMNLMQVDLVKKKKRKGFTLIELIVVIAILGILAAVAIPRLTGFRDTAKVAAATANEKVVNNAIQVYKAANGAVPTDVDTFAELVDELQSKGYITTDVQADLKLAASWNDVLPKYTTENADAITR
jgi:prepilin-type N-terminal cleavage/methylation domain-containing protein